MDEPVDEIVSRPLPWSRQRVLATATVSVVALALVVLAAIAAHRLSQRPTTHRDQPAVPLRAKILGASVFIEPLPQCLRTDHAHQLRLAVQVTNLSNDTLRLVDATAAAAPKTGRTLGPPRFWSDTCAGTASSVAPVIGPAGHFVVGFTFALGNDCPANTAVSTTLSFAEHGRRLQTQSSALADLSRLHFIQCAG
jgi:hypothetical protein